MEWELSDLDRILHQTSPPIVYYTLDTHIIIISMLHAYVSATLAPVPEVLVLELVPTM